MIRIEPVGVAMWKRNEINDIIFGHLRISLNHPEKAVSSCPRLATTSTTTDQGRTSYAIFFKAHQSITAPFKVEAKSCTVRCSLSSHHNWGLVWSSDFHTNSI